MVPQVDELMNLLCRVVIRQEDTLNILKQSTSWVMFARTGSPSIIPGLVIDGVALIWPA